MVKKLSMKPRKKPAVKPKVKKPAKKATAKKPVKIKQPKPIGAVTHFFSGLDVAIVKFKKNVKKGDKIKFKGHTTDFEQEIKSMQYDHKDIAIAKKGQDVGIKVGKKIRDGDKVYKA